MTEPNETNKRNEEVNEELSSDELKGVSGGLSNPSYEGLGFNVNGPKKRGLFREDREGGHDIND